MKDLYQAIDQISTDAQNWFGQLDEAHLNWQPNAQTWSIAQNLEHLMVVNRSYYPLVESLKEGNLKLPWISKFPFLVRSMGNLILNSVQPENKKKVSTFNIWQPRSSALPHDQVQLFLDHQAELKEFMHNCEDLVAAGAIIYSPANKKIVYKLGVALEIMVAHESRHLQQAHELLEVLP
jgi:uncharacterized damage-inducible protein DinB